ncbi:MAG: heavy metal translocating P-type ATPase [Bacteroidota bacterium]
MKKVACYHCGDECWEGEITVADKNFCCNGCKTVFEIFSENDLTCYYDLTNSPGATPPELQGRFDFLDNKEITKKLIDFSDETIEIASFYIPHIHCSSCIWILENLTKLNPAITTSQVNFPKKTVSVHYHPQEISLKELVILLASIGYEPYISLEDFDKKQDRVNRSLTYKIGIAGFAFGNVMFLSFPEYFEVSEYWLDQYKVLFRWLMFAFSLPVVFYAAQDYFISAYKGLKSKMLNIDVPIALGISVLFLRSTVEIAFDLGTGFFDSLTGLVFFLLLGKLIQQKTYSFLSFERDYKSYFPIGITQIDEDKNETNVPIYDVKKGDRLLIRSEELIPVDGVLVAGNANLDYSFVTGESRVVEKVLGQKLYAGGKQKGSSIEIIAEKSVEQSYLTQLWSKQAFQQEGKAHFQSLIDQVSQYFTWAVLLIATLATSFWLFYEPSLALNVFTAVLIIACPCAIALATPFTLGNLLRIFGKKGFYLKNTAVIEHLAALNHFVFDKTGTLTTNAGNEIVYHGSSLSKEDEILLKSTLRNSNHPLSRKLYAFLKTQEIKTIDDFKEHTGQGIEAKIDNKHIRLGNADFAGNTNSLIEEETVVHYSNNEEYKGRFVFQSAYRSGIWSLLGRLKSTYKLMVLSGDNEGEKKFLETKLPAETQLFFNQKPDDKLTKIEALQKQNNRVAMVGDGLNDAGALAQSDVGIAVAENINVFTPACDAILDAKKLNHLDWFLTASIKGIRIIKLAFFFSFLYNIVGLYFAVTGQLMPVIAAILMPLSSISIVAFTTFATNWVEKGNQHPLYVRSHQGQFQAAPAHPGQLTGLAPWKERPGTNPKANSYQIFAH